MRASTGRIHRYRLHIIVSFRIHHRTPAIVDALRPIHFHEWESRNELSRDPVDGVEESILRGLRQDLTDAPIDPQVKQHELLYAVEIPVVVRHCLKMPLELPGCEIHGK